MSDCNRTSIGEPPSTYERSPAWESTGLTAASNIASIDGKVGVITIGMSSMNTISGSLANQFHAHAERHSSVTLINGATSGKVARFWADPNDDCWTTLADRITAAGLTAAQCQIVWVMMTNSYPATYGVMTDTQMRAIFTNLASAFVNMQIGFVSSHGYTGYSTDTRLPEPTTYNDSLLLATYAGDASLPFWVDFYDVWCDGETANARTAKVGSLTAANDPIAYVCADVNSDGVHPSTTGRNKIRDSILQRWLVDPVAVALWEGAGAPHVPPPPARRGLIVGVS